MCSSDLNIESRHSLIPNPKDYESISEEGEGQDEEIIVNTNSKLPLTPNPKDYESTTKEG